MRLHERYVRAALHRGWHVAEPSARLNREQNGDLLVTRERERIRVWFDDRGNVSDAVYDILWTGDTTATARQGGAFWQVWRASQRDADNGEQVLEALYAPRLRDGRYQEGEHVVLLPLDPKAPMTRRLVVATYYGTAMRHTLALADEQGNVSDYVPLANVRRVR